MQETDKIIKARIHQGRGFFEAPQVFVTLEDGSEHSLFTYYPDEISFRESEFAGITVAQARRLKFEKDRAYLRS
jgi:hypothetical protein